MVEPVAALVPDPLASAKRAGLRYVSDASPGLRRFRRGHGFAYLDARGRTVRRPDTLRRIRALAIPPAWTEVWICPDPDGHIQAVGRDARGRKQYRYHAEWRAFRDATKFHKMIDFAAALPSIRAHVSRDLARPGLPREKVLATVVRLLEETAIRVGNEEYARANRHYGLTTLRNAHAKVEGATLHFRFIGKSGKVRVVDVRDPQVARVVRKCQDLPGQRLFEYPDDDGAMRTIESEDVNDYLRAITGADFTAKDFRTWAATVHASLALQAAGAFGSATQGKRNVAAAIKVVAERLGNTPAVCRKCYVHPALLEVYLAGELAAELVGGRAGKLNRDEAAVARLLARAAKRARRTLH